MTRKGTQATIFDGTRPVSMNITLLKGLLAETERDMSRFSFTELRSRMDLAYNTLQDIEASLPREILNSTLHPVT